MIGDVKENIFLDEGKTTHYLNQQMRKMRVINTNRKFCSAHK